jgi:hypothetical protein
MTVVITFTNTRSAQPGPQRNQPYSHKRSAHSVSAVPLARPPTSPRTPRTAIPPVPTRSSSDGDALRRKGLVGRGKTGISIQTSDLKLGRGPNRSLSLDISAQNADGMVSSPSEGSLTKAPLHVQRALSANGSGKYRSFALLTCSYIYRIYTPSRAISIGKKCFVATLAKASTCPKNVCIGRAFSFPRHHTPCHTLYYNVICLNF